jgi:hypothetical protein
MTHLPHYVHVAALDGARLRIVGWRAVAAEAQ